VALSSTTTRKICEEGACAGIVLLAGTGSESLKQGYEVNYESPTYPIEDLFTDIYPAISSVCFGKRRCHQEGVSTSTGQDGSMKMKIGLLMFFVGGRRNGLNTDESSDRTERRE
jgi:hypothetical protein